MKRAQLGMFATALVVAATFAPAGAVSTKTWTSASYRDFDEGEADKAIITSLGEVMPGFGTGKVDLETEAAWAAVRAPGGTIYAGAVTGGSIFAVDGDKKRLLATLEAETPWIGALALSGDTLYAGTLGTATIHALDAKSGKARKLATLDGADHVWAILVDGGTLWVATGPDGKLFKVDAASGKASVAWESGDKHLLALTRASDGALWLGTSDEAILYRFDPKTSQARAIADFAGTEVRAIVEVDGAFVVAANEFEAKLAVPPAPPSKAAKGTPVKPPEAGSAPGADKPAPEAPRPGERKGKGALFRVETDGRVEQLHALGEGYFQALAAGPDGSVWAAAGAQGRVYQVRRDRTVITAFDVSERQVNALMAWDGGLAFATGDGGAVYTSTGPAKGATYTSKVFDAGFVAQFGNLAYRGTGVTVETRSGNTAKPGKGWTAWQKLGATSKAGGDILAGRVGSAKARYFQYKVTLDNAAGSVLKHVRVYYVPQNQRPRVTDITVEGATSSKAVTTAAGPTKPRSPILKLKWKIEGGDDDELAYTVEVRAEDDSEWRKVPSGPDPLTKAELEWNTEALPDGYYRLRVTASDAGANPPDAALQHTFTGTPFLIDNQKPQVAGVEVKAPFASGRAIDSFSRIDEIAYQLDGGDWVMAYPKDGIFDDLAEAFTLALPRTLAPGTHTLAIRVADEGDNIGATAVTFKVK